MRKVIIAILLLLGVFALNAQNYEIDAFNNQTVSNCTGNAIFYDSGGQFGNYSPNENYTITFCPSTAGQVVSIDFIIFNLGTSDELCAYNGTNTLAPSMGCFSSVNGTFSLVATNATGCITITFSSNGFDQAAGWRATVTCQSPCQTVQASIVSTVPALVPANTGYINICEGDAVTLTASGIYPQNGTTYTQSNATSIFRWVIEGQEFFGQSVTHTFVNAGGYNVLLDITDVLGCNSNVINTRVRVAPPPFFSGTNASPMPVCLGDTVNLNGKVTPRVEGFITSLTRGDSIFLPDGTNVCYQTTLKFTDFAPGQTLTNINDFLGVCVNMEHSWIGDLDLFLTCPNGTQVTLHPYGVGGGGVNLGQPISVGNGPGIGYEYCWTPTATQTWSQAITSGSGIVLVNGQQTLKSGNYATHTPLSALIGCPLNGQWEIEICDNLAIDDGYIFNWGIDFSPNLYSNVDTFTSQHVSHQWKVPGGITLPGKNVPYITTSVGNAAYTYSTTNSFGCTHDTTINFTVLGPPNMPVLSCSTTNATQITVTRTSVPNATSYEIRVNNGSWQTFTGTTFTVSGLNPLQSVVFQLRAKGPAGCDLYSAVNTITCTTAACQLSMNLNSLTQVSCTGAADGAALVSATTNIMPLTYTLDGITSNSTGSFSNLTAGSHTIAVIDGNTCEDSITFNITSPIVLNINASSGNVSCHGGNNGFASVTVNGGSPPYSFAWSNGGNTATIIDLVAGSYIVTVTDNKGCQQSSTVVITQPSALSLSFQKTDVSCFNGTNGTATVIVSGGTPNYTYKWSTFPIQTTSTATNLPDNIYNVTVTDGKNCTIVGNTTILEPPSLILTVDTNRVSCHGAMDGEGIPTVSGGTAPYTSYLWSNGDTRLIADTLDGGFHSLTVTDFLGCTVTRNFGIYEPTKITNTFSLQQVTCFGLSDGWAMVTAAGGVGPNYTYQWSSNANSQTGQFAGNLTGGTYAVITTDRENCSVLNTVYVYAPVLVFVDTIYSTPALCHYSNEGTVGTAGSGGSGTLTYTWSNGQTGTNLINLTRGQYTVTIADVNGCVGIDSTIVASPDSIEITFATTPLLCNNDATGTASATVIGGVPQYSYAWNTNPVNTTANINNLQARFYALTITDNHNCIQVDSVEVVEPNLLLATTTYVEPLCFGDANGSSRIFPTGGNGDYLFSWATSPVQTDTTAIGLTAGTYNYTVVDSNNCTFNGTVTVTEPTLLTSSSSGINITCRDAANGVAIVSPSGGSYPYSYNWSSSALNDSIIFSLDTGWHYVTITDFFGCIVLDSVYLTQPNYVTSTISSTNLSCFESGDGTATVTPSGGVGNYSFVWSNNAQTTITATGLNAGWNYVTITDGNNCIGTNSIFLTQPTKIALTGSSTKTICYGQNNGTATIVANGGSPGYTYSWGTSPTQITPTATNLLAGTYLVTVTDSKNCSTIGSVLVEEPNELMINFAKSDMSCFDLPDGSITANPIGGTPSYNYNWSIGQSTKTISNLDVGAYTVTVTDNNGCVATNSISILEPTLLTSTTISYPSTCFNGNDGSAVVIANGGTPDISGRYSYLWNATFPQATDSAVSLIGGRNYTVIITDANGCKDTNSVSISQPPPITWTTSNILTSCDNSSDGSAFVTASGGVGGFSYQWDANANNQVGASATNLGKGNYFVTIQDANGCEEKTNVVITGPEPIKIIGSLTAEIPCKGDSVGSLSAMAAGGSGLYSFQWDANAKNQTSTTAYNLKAGWYLVTVTDDKGCIGTDSFEVYEPAFELNSNLIKSDIQCTGARNGEILINTIGGTMPYVYKVDQGDYSAANVIQGLFANEYIIYTRDGNGCETVDTTEIFEPAPFSVFLPFDTTIDVGTDVTIVPVLDNGVPPFVYEWQPQDTTLTCWDCKSPTTINLLYERVYTLTVTDAMGCSATDEITVRVNQDRAIYIATGFTPNNDGVNDVLFVQGTLQIAKVIHFQVYNRWGELVFKNGNFQPNIDGFGWNGYFEGNKAPAGVYGWITDIEFLDGEVLRVQGNTTLIW